MKKAVKLICLLLVALLVLAGCSKPDLGIVDDVIDAAQDTVSAKEFSNAGVTMTLTTKFLDFTDTETNDGEYEFLYADEVHCVLALREDKESLVETFGELNAQSYGDMIAQLYEIEAKTEIKDNFATYAYEVADEEDGSKVTFTCVFLETEQDFWNIQISCPSDRYTANQADIWSWLTSIKVA